MKYALTTIVLFSIMACRHTTSKPEIHYSLSGKGGITLLFVHGWCINGSYWDSQTAFFKDSFQTLTVDLRGHGQSKTSRTEMTIEAHAQDVADLIEYLDLDSVILIGHSMSGNINLHVYEKVPERIIGFIGIDNLQEVGKVYTAEENRQIDDFFAGMKKDYTGVVSQFAMNNLFHARTDTLVKQRVVSDFMHANPPLAISTLESLFRDNTYEQKMLPRLKLPLLLIVTENSIKSEASLQQYCPNGYKYWTIADCGHYPMIERPEVFNGLLRDAVQYALKQ